MCSLFIIPSAYGNKVCFCVIIKINFNPSKEKVNRGKIVTLNI